MTHASIPGSLIGYRKDGRPIHLLAGGSGEGEQEPTTGADGGTPEGGDNPDPQGGGTNDGGAGTSGGGKNTTSAKPAPAADGKPGGRSLEDLPEWAQKEVRDARKGEGDYRAQLRQAETERDQAKKAEQERLDAIAKALGLKADDTPPDPAELTRKLEASQQEARERRVELAVYQAADANGAKASLLLDSRSFMSGMKGLDPDAPDFNDRLVEAISSATEKDARFKADAPAPTVQETKPKPPARSGGDFNSPGGSKPITRDQLSKMSPEEIEKAHQEGRLDHLL